VHLASALRSGAAPQLHTLHLRNVDFSVLREEQLAVSSSGIETGFSLFAEALAARPYMKELSFAGSVMDPEGAYLRTLCRCVSLQWFTVGYVGSDVASQVV
jgi:hypothetical protein